MTNYHDLNSPMKNIRDTIVEKKEEAPSEREGISIGKESKLLAKHSIIYGIGASINKLAAFLLLPIYTHYLSTYDYGIKELVALTTDIITTIIATSIASAFYRFYFEYSDEEHRNLVLSSSYIFMAGTGFFFASLLSLGTPLLAHYILDSGSLYYYFLISFSSMWFQMMNEIGMYYLRATRKSLQYNIISIFRLILAISLNVVFIIFLHMGVLGIFVSTLIASIITFCILNIPQLFKIGLNFSPRIIKEMLRFGLPMIPSELGAIVVRISDRFFIKAYCSIADTGLYSLGFRFGLLPGMFVSEPFNQVWQPRRLEVYKQPNAEEIFGKIFTYFLVLITFSALFTAVLTREVLMIMADRQFWSAYKIVPIIVLADVIFTLQYHFNMGFIIEKQTKYFAYINVSNAILNLIMNFLLIPRYGAFGAAYATLISFTYVAAMTYILSRRFFKIHFEFVRLVKIFIAAVAVFIVAQQITFFPFYINIMAKTLAILCFPLILYMLGFFTRKERDLIFSLIRPDPSLQKTN
jgi:O-antigen/teichoic acid export membrane protein